MATTEASSSGSSKPPNKLVAIKNAVHDFLHEKNNFTYVFELAEKYTKVKREYIFIGKQFCLYWCGVGGITACSWDIVISQYV